MTSAPVLVAGAWRLEDPDVATFGAVNPATGELLEARFPVSPRKTLDEALDAGKLAARELARVPAARVADFLEGFAEALEARAEALVKIAALETGLPSEPRLSKVELPRTTDQLRQAARAARERTFTAPVIDTRNDIRSMYGPLGGPVFVLGPNNFPFAFNAVSGGDFAAALAAKNAVIAKAHPNHPGTTRLLAETAFSVLERSALPRTALQLIYQVKPEDGLALVGDRRLAATAFTGSRRAGLALKAAADRAGRPIYLEMSSINPVLLLPGALEERKSEIAEELCASCTLGAGQFCTNPGLSVVIDDASGRALLAELEERLAKKPPGVLLSEGGVTGLARAVQTLVRAGAELLVGGRAVEGVGFRFENTLLTVSAERFLQNPDALQTEAFGAVHLMVLAGDPDQMLAVAEALEGNLTATVYSHQRGQDDALYDRVASILRAKVGRLLNDKMPTGVSVSPAMNHGGPFPATANAGVTAVGLPASIRRFTALHCYDAVRPERLPEELSDENPTGRLWRFIDGTWSTGDAVR